MAPPFSPSACRRRTSRGFTLVELITATSLMTIMMLGMVQIFAIVTTTAGEAQGAQFAYEQARGILDTIHRDIRGFTREGYMKIVVSPPTPSNSQYAGDSLAFTTIGPTAGAWGSGATPASGAASEVLYTLQVADGSSRPSIIWLGAAGSSNLVATANPRRGILARGQWMIGSASGGTLNNGADDSDFSAAPTLWAFMTDNTNFWRRPERYRTAGATPTPYTYVWPVTSTMGLDTGAASPQPKSLRRVAGSCVSEFYVEYLSWTGSDYAWTHGNRDMRDLNCLGSNNQPANINCPVAIRVTAAIHDPDDRKPLASGAPRFQGYALQEVFWIRDP